MKAAVYEGGQRFTVRDIPTPAPGPGQVLVRVHRSAICGTDVHAFMYDIAPAGSVFGHEIAGEIVAVGPGVERLQIGQRVVAGGGDPPPGFESPMRSNPRYNYRTMGFRASTSGGYAEYQVLPDWRPSVIPDGVSYDAASLTEPCSVAVRAVRRSAIALGDSVAVLGAGPIGMLTMQAARAAGAGRVFVSEPAPGRAAAARDLGASEVLDPREEDVVARLVELTGGRGVDVTIDCAGLGTTLNQAFDSTRPGGQVVLVAVPWEPLSIEPVDWMAREIDMRVSFASQPEDWRIALAMLADGRISTAPLMQESSLIRIEQIQQAFEALTAPSSELQVVIDLA
jgi:(R,R)-butanediol dehydrogenase/meso-butanediol dehydrogenase/diacetyl reductase